MDKISILLVVVALAICVSGRPQGQWPYENVNQHSPSSSGYSDPSLYSYQYGYPGKSPFNYRSASFRDDEDDDDDNDDDEEGVNFKQELVVGTKAEGGHRVSGGIQATPAPPRVVEPTRAPPPPTYPPFPPATPPTTTKKPAKKVSEDSSEENSDEADEDQSDEDQDEGTSDEDQEDSPGRGPPGRGPPRGQRPQYERPPDVEFPDGYFDEQNGEGPPPPGYGQGPPQGFGQGPPQGYNQGPPPKGYGGQGPPPGPPGKGQQQGPSGQGPPQGYYQNDREQSHNDRPPPGPGPPPGLPSSNVRVTYSRPNVARRRSDVPVESKRGEMNSKKFIEVPAAEGSEVEKTSGVKSASEVVKSKPESLSSVSVEEEENVSGVSIPRPVVLPGSEEAVVQEAEAEVDDKNEISSVEVDAVVVDGKEKAPAARPGRVEAFIPGYITNHGEILVPVDTVINHGPISILPDPYTPVARGYQIGGPNTYPQIGQNQLIQPQMFQSRQSQQPMNFYYDDAFETDWDFNDYYA